MFILLGLQLNSLTVALSDNAMMKSPRLLNAEQKMAIQKFGIDMTKCLKHKGGADILIKFCPRNPAVEAFL